MGRSAQAILDSGDFDARVRSLLCEALESGKHCQAEQCEIALGPQDHTSGIVWLQRAAARVRCAEALAEKEALAAEAGAT